MGYGQMDRRMDELNDRWTDTASYRDAKTHLKTCIRWTDRPTDRPTDTPFYQDARTHLKSGPPSRII